MPLHRYRPAHDRGSRSPDEPTGLARRGGSSGPRCGCPSTCATATRRWPSRWTPPRKRRMFDLLRPWASRRSRSATPRASQTDFDFVRHLADSGAVPDDVTSVVFTAARADLIDATFDADRRRCPAPSSTCTPRPRPPGADVVLGRDRREAARPDREAAAAMARRADRQPGRRALPSSRPRSSTRPSPTSSWRSATASPRCGTPRPTARHPQPARHGGDRHAQRLRRPDRVHAPPPGPRATR